jgi:signal transduction histidine kinase
MNARQATEQANGRMTLRLATGQETSTARGCVFVAVAHSCMDFDADIEGRPFTAFYGAREMGTGLTISRSMVKAHRGEIRASACDGVGTTFAVRLPSIAPGGP